MGVDLSDRRMRGILIRYAAMDFIYAPLCTYVSGPLRLHQLSCVAADSVICILTNPHVASAPLYI
jgi:hypothetical protein